MKYCTNCGVAIEAKFAFCPECGTKVVMNGDTCNESIIKDLEQNFDLYLRKYCELIEKNEINDDTKEKIKNYTFEGAQLNISRIQAFLAEAYRTGDLFVEKNLEQYTFWLKKSAENGFADSQYLLALLYSPLITDNKNEYIEKNEDTSINWLTKAIEQEHKEAIMLYANICCKNNKPEAFRRYFSLIGDWNNPDDAPVAKLRIAELLSFDRELAKVVLDNPKDEIIDELISLFVSHAANTSEELKSEVKNVFEFKNGRWIKKGSAPLVQVNSEAVPGVAKGSFMSKYDLLTYVQMAAKMEKGYYRLNRIRNNIQGHINELNNRISKVKQERTVLPPQPPVEPVDYSNDKNYIESQREYIISRNDTRDVLAAMFLPPVWIAGEKLKKHKEIKKAKEKLRAKYEIEYKQYLIDKEDFPRKLRAHNDFVQRKRAEEHSLNISIQELFRLKSDADEKLKISGEHRELFYSADVIYAKYRSLIPIVMFCEYLESGRCENIKECINTYEDDVRYKHIVTSLENIADAEYSKQQAICELTSSVNHGMSQMSDALYGINEQINISNYNLKVQAECQQQMADDLSAIKWYEDWKFINNTGR